MKVDPLYSIPDPGEMFSWVRRSRWILPPLLPSPPFYIFSSQTTLGACSQHLVASKCIRFLRRSPCTWTGKYRLGRWLITCHPSPLHWVRFACPGKHLSGIADSIPFHPPPQHNSKTPSIPGTPIILRTHAATNNPEYPTLGKKLHQHCSQTRQANRVKYPFYLECTRVYTPFKWDGVSTNTSRASNRAKHAKTGQLGCIENVYWSLHKVTSAGGSTHR